MINSKKYKRENNDYRSYVDFETLLKENTIEVAAEILLESSYENIGLINKDTLDFFLEFVHFKLQTGYWIDFNDAYPVKRMNDDILEKEVQELINEHLYPDITLRLLKFFTRNLYEPDSNLFIANLVYSKDIIRAIYDTYKVFREAIFLDKEKRHMTVRSIQQFAINASEQLSSPLEAATLLKYVLEFFALKANVSDIYSMDDLRLSKKTSS